MSDCTSSLEICELLSVVKKGVDIIQLTKLSSISSMALYLYDYFLTCDDEWSLMWTAEFGTGKVLYFLNRYLTLFVILFINVGICLPHASSSLCLSWIRFHWISGIVIGVVTELPLLLRIYALYNKSRAILVLMSSFLALTAIGMMALAGKIMQAEGATMTYFGPEFDLHMCTPTNLRGLFKFFFIPMLLNESLLLCLAVVKWVQFSGFRGMQTNAMSEMVKDSIIYFMGTFPFFLTSQMIWAFAGELYIEFPVGFTLTVASIMSQRLLLKVRKYHYGRSPRACGGFGTAQRRRVTNFDTELAKIGRTVYDTT